MRIGRIAAHVSVLMLASGAHARSDEVDLKVRSSGAVLVPVAIDGQGPFTFLLDTGSSHTVVGSDLAFRLALPVEAKVRVLTPGGPEEALVVRLDRVDLGTASASGLTSSVVSMARLRGREPGVLGILGQDFLGLFDYTVDYRRKRLRWAAEPADGRTRLPLVAAGDRRLVQLAGDGPREPALLVPDTGSEAFVICALVRELRLGDVTLRNQRAVVLAREGRREVEGDGLLPLHHFSAVSFNNSEGYLSVRR